GYLQMNYPHSLMFILYARAMQGRVAETRKAIEMMRTSLASMVPDMVTVGEMYTGFIEVRMGMWDEVLAAPKPKGPNSLFTAMWHYARALAAFGEGRRADAQREQQHFEELRKSFDRNMEWHDAAKTVK
ncbi:MAG: hypothetical protein JOY90_11835, partial [Bradyrhizobium sp.]|uniref:hypothetical protein n=1 Tax=Bradyrhizobium sp. TaxID=376 RepID=UPI001DA21B0E